ncbi:class I SAM-dependent methyltransferase [Alicyclobacillus fodiniaquatilis]|jgi:SAM-dependent methyltransferase|uniref:Class I SAM-dependent methyltransferase n=1 Tax=Alicyclobacillus fodiniaquatilis TaxID=1661150 RepID=A0ABW4JHE8_9BACL
MQEQLSHTNKTAWETKAYQAWIHEFGTPSQLAEELKQKLTHTLRYWLKYIGDPTGKRVLNLLGSHGRKAISLALMGADVTVVDISEENRAYATQVAEAADVQLNYICSDALNIPNEDTLGHFDIVLMEFGILHYFTDLNPIFSVVNRRLGTNGRYLLTDFHPFAKAWKVTNLLKHPTGNYFDDSIHEGPVAFAQLLPEGERSGLSPTATRSWTIGDIITSIASQGLFIRTFEEIRNAQDPTFPEFYTLVADKVDVQLTPLNP